MAKEPMDTLIWNNLYWLIERSYQQTLCCQRYVDRKRKLKRNIDWTLVIIPGIGSLLYFWEPIAAFISAVSTAVIGFLNKIAPHLTQQESELNELDGISRKYASIRADAENLVMRFREDDSFGNADVRKALHKLQKSSDELEVRTNVLFRHISDKEDLFLKTETENYLKNIIMNNSAKPVRVPTPTKPHIPQYIPPHGEPHGGNPRQIHSTPPPPPTKK